MVLHLWDPHTPASPFGRVLATRFLLGMVHGITPGRAHLAHQLLRCGKRRLQPGGMRDALSVSLAFALQRARE